MVIPFPGATRAATPPFAIGTPVRTHDGRYQGHVVAYQTGVTGRPHKALIQTPVLRTWKAVDELEAAP